MIERKDVLQFAMFIMIAMSMVVCNLQIRELSEKDDEILLHIAEIYSAIGDVHFVIDHK